MPTTSTLATRSEKRGSSLLVRSGGGQVVCEHCRVADTPLARMRGLLGRRYMNAGEGVLLKPAAAIHTAFMRFPIDAVFIDEDGVVLHVAHELRPWRMAAQRGAKAVLELPAGSATLESVELGTRLELDPKLPPRESQTK